MIPSTMYEHLALTVHTVVLMMVLSSCGLIERARPPWKSVCQQVGPETSAATPESPLRSLWCPFQGLCCHQDGAFDEKDFRAYAGPKGWDRAQASMSIVTETLLYVTGAPARRSNPWTREKISLAPSPRQFQNDFRHGNWHSLDVSRPPLLQVCQSIFANSAADERDFFTSKASRCPESFRMSRRCGRDDIVIPRVQSVVRLAEPVTVYKESSVRSTSKPAARSAPLVLAISPEILSRARPCVSAHNP